MSSLHHEVMIQDIESGLKKKLMVLLHEYLLLQYIQVRVQIELDLEHNLVMMDIQILYSHHPVRKER